ncbi:MAG: hypothetical protein ACI4RP_07255 [Acutalibacteraceae bacterium]
MNAAKKRKITAVAAFALIVFSYVLTTIAWLTMQTGEVTNTFTVGDVDIELQEHEIDNNTHGLSDTLLTRGAFVEGGDNNNLANYYFYVPGLTMKKDPAVVVKPGSAACWLFIKIVPCYNYFSGNDVDPIIQWEIDNTEQNGSAWKQVPDTKYYWYRKVDAVPSNSEAAVFNVLKGQSVRINDIFSEEQFESIKHSPILYIRAGAIQSDNIPTNADENEAAKIALSMMSETFRTLYSHKYADMNESLGDGVTYPEYTNPTTD